MIKNFKSLLCVALLLKIAAFAQAQDAAQMPSQCVAVSPMDSERASWNGWGADLANTRFQPETSGRLTIRDAGTLRLKWAFGFPGARAVSGQPAVVGGRVFVSSDNGYVYALDEATGCVYWSFHADGAVRSSVSVDRPGPGRPYAVYFGDARANVYAVDATSGDELWKTRVDTHATARITGGVRFFEGRVYVPVASGEEGAGSAPNYACCTFRGSVVALNASDGKEIWKTFTIPEEPRPTTTSANGTQLWGPSGAAVWNSPTIDSKRRVLYVGTGNAYSAPAAPTTDAILALDLDTGKMVWSVQETANDVWKTSCIASPAGCGPDHDFGSPPILHQLTDGSSLLVAGQKSGMVWAHDPDREGALVWKSPLVNNTTEFGGKLIWGGAADDQNAYFGLGPGGIAAVRLRDGERRWFADLQPGSAGGHDGALTAIPGAVISGGWDGIVRVLGADDGRVIWEFNTMRDFDTVNGVAARGGSMAAAGPTVADGLLFVPSGYVGVRNGSPGNVLLVFAPDR